MDILRWLAGLCLGIQILGQTLFAQGSALPVPEDFISHGPQYRFQYFVRDERGDYKTQEEAGEGGNARGSYAVEEPDGDLRIVQYTADLGGGFKAHIKVDHAGKSSSELQEIDIPAEEMRKLINENRKKASPEVPEMEKSSKSYALGPPRKMSDIVMEQAAAIREIISKEIEAEEKREAAEKLRGEITAGKNRGVDVVDCEKQKAEKESGGVVSEVEATKHSSQRTAKARKIDAEAYRGVEVSDESPDGSQISNARNAAAKNYGDDEQSPVVRVALSPKTQDATEGAGAAVVQGKMNPREYSGREAYVGTPDPALVGPLLGGPVRNFSFKNRIMFYKPTKMETDSNHSQDPKRLGESDGDPSYERIDDLLKSLTKSYLPYGEDREEIYVWAPPDKNEKSHSGRKGRYIQVPYEVLRPYLAAAEAEAEGKMDEKESERSK